MTVPSLSPQIIAECSLHRAIESGAGVGAWVLADHFDWRAVLAAAAFLPCAVRWRQGCGRAGTLPYHRRVLHLPTAFRGRMLQRLRQRLTCWTRAPYGAYAQWALGQQVSLGAATRARSKEQGLRRPRPLARTCATFSACPRREGVEISAERRRLRPDWSVAFSRSVEDFGGATDRRRISARL